ncbi:MAG: hypothetical protein KDK89_09925 [Alphaproteobacteria bacterium]|nr:hypothetical protein [Alphaproteobacteria bacterium]
MGRVPPENSGGPAPAVADYKRILASVLEQRPSGTRQRLASALEKNRSFISQITNPVYATPIPATHVETIFDLCHFSQAERTRFVAAYERAHPGRLKIVSGDDKHLVRTIELPDLGDDAHNRRLRTAVNGFVEDIVELIRSATRKESRS